MFICTCSKFNVKKFASVKNTWINFFRVTTYSFNECSNNFSLSICVDTRMFVRSILYAISQTFSALYNWTNMTAPWGAQNWREKKYFCCTDIDSKGSLQKEIPVHVQANKGSKWVLLLCFTSLSALHPQLLTSEIDVMTVIFFRILVMRWWQPQPTWTCFCDGSRSHTWSGRSSALCSRSVTMRCWFSSPSSHASIPIAR